MDQEREAFRAGVDQEREAFRAGVDQEREAFRAGTHTDVGGAGAPGATPPRKKKEGQRKRR
ncbi:hypothetical protein, partial [Streptomyces sp. NPDC058731]|uniref:hypothetical protein n=1 Tax=Streptomyces sp. NPDC058731 TaxID=3346613 RepID=UPI00368C106E